MIAGKLPKMRRLRFAETHFLKLATLPEGGKLAEHRPQKGYGFWCLVNGLLTSLA